ncbi:hypothetical protein [Roseiflexus castenholzii]|uniref:B-box zinc finger protein n=1 Tax=Roseiflexus castenholzii TaxID=120962 RepID=UPI002355B6DE
MQATGEFMTESTATEVQQLITEGRAAALAGDTFTARARFRRATELDSENVDAWIGLSSVAPILAEKREYLRRALAIDPTNAEATASLAYVEKLLADGLQIAPSHRRQERQASGDASPLLSAPEPLAVEVAYCYIHPDRETGLRCVQCNRPICGSCAQMTPVGQLCPECRKARRPPHYQADLSHMLIGGVTGFFAALIGSVLVIVLGGVPFLGLFLAMMAGPLTGALTARIVEQLTRKRGKTMQASTGIGLGLGALPLVGFGVIALLNGAFLQLLLIGLWVTLLIVTAVARLR